MLLERKSEFHSVQKEVSAQANNKVIFMSYFIIFDLKNVYCSMPKILARWLNSWYKKLWN